MSAQRHDLLPYFALGFILLVLVEAVWSWRHRNGRYSYPDTWTNLASGLGSGLVGSLVVGGLVVLFELLYQLSWKALPLNGWTLLLALPAVDLCHYWAHRFTHRVRLGWAAHVTHHSSQEYNLSVALRQAWTQQALLFWFFLPLPLLGFPIEYILLAKSLNGAYQFWIHTQYIKRMPRWFEWVFNSPAHHRVHHASNPRYLDRNYAGIFIVWDRLFGTFQDELAEEPVRYGLTTNIRTHNLLYVQFHEWGALLRDSFHCLVRTRSLKRLWQVVFLPPAEAQLAAAEAVQSGFSVQKQPPTKPGVVNPAGKPSPQPQALTQAHTQPA